MIVGSGPGGEAFVSTLTVKELSAILYGAPLDHSCGILHHLRILETDITSKY